MHQVKRQLTCLALVVALVLLASAGIGQAATSHLVSFHGKGFSISLPSKPHRRTKSLGVLGKEVIYLAESKGRAAGIGYIREPAHVGPTDLVATIRGEAGGVGATSANVHDAVDATYQGFPARDARITAPAQNLTLFTRVIDTSKRLYILVYVLRGTGRTNPPAVYLRIRASLRLG